MDMDLKSLLCNVTTVKEALEKLELKEITKKREMAKEVFAKFVDGLDLSEQMANDRNWLVDQYPGLASEIHDLFSQYELIYQKVSYEIV